MGARFYGEESDLSLTDSTLSNNQVTGGSGAKGGTPAGGAIFVYQGTSRSGIVSLNRVSIINNTNVAGVGSSQPGGALGGGVALQDAAATALIANITNTVIAGNSLTSPGGGAVAGNSGGGAIWNDGATANLAQDTLADNSVQSNMTGQALLLYGGSDNLAWDIVANHNAAAVPALAPVAGGAITLTGPVLFANNNNNGTFGGSGNALSAGSAGFVDSPNRDYHLFSTSTAKDAAGGSPLTVDRDNTPRVGTPDLGAYESVPSNAFSGSIYGSVYVDVNANGQQDAIDYGIPNQHVWLDLNNDGRYEPGEPAAVTDTSGNWFFSGVTPGSYVVRYYTPPGPYFQTAPLGGAARTVDVETSVVSGVNFGVAGDRGSGTATISGNVFSDPNGNAFQDAGESSIPGQNVFVDLNNDGVYEPGEPALATDANGNFQLTGLTPGTYTVRYYVPAGFRQTTAGGQGFTLTLATGADASGVSFGVASAF